MKNTFDFHSTDDEEKKLLVDLILYSSSCFQNVVQSLGVSIARPRNKWKKIFSFKSIDNNEKNLLMDPWVKTEINFR